MASTQELTKLPAVQYAGMDYSTVISEIKSIIDNNKNWKSNWTQFYSSEAGTMLVQLMAWICDNLSVRQDLLYNEGFLTTAQSDNSKYRLLQQIGHFLTGTNGATANISVSLDQPTGENIYLSNHRDNAKDISAIKNKILKFKAPDINGKEVNWEILRKDEDENILYTEEVLLLGNATYYETGVTDAHNGEPYQLIAIQGETNYLEFSSDEEGDVTFNLGLTECDTDTIAVYDIENAKQHIRVNSFQELCALSKEEIEQYSGTSCYILERNDNGYLQIRYPSTTLIENNSIIANYAYKPGKKIGVFVRTSKGSDGNIAANYFEAKATVKTEQGNSIDIVIKNELAAYNGKNSETLGDAVKTAPLDLRINSRAVTIEDFDRVLQKNNFVLNSVSYSPYNEPQYFENYYGRKIYPHETFGFISSNKNFVNIPISSLNYFPWVDTNKEHVLNEYYNFFNCDTNQEFNSNGNSFFSGYLQKTLNKEINAESDAGFDNNWLYTNNKTYEFYHNGTIFTTSAKLLSTINSELKFDETRDKFMEVKVHSDNFDGLYLKEIQNNLFSRIEDKDFTFKTDNNIICDDTSYSATFTSNSIFEDEIDVLSYSNMHIVIDDNIDLEVDLLKELPADKSDKIKEYYLRVTNDVVYNEDNIEEEITKDYLNGTDIAKYRRGILELCRDALTSYLNDTDNNYFEIARIKNNVNCVDLGLQIPESSFDNFDPEDENNVFLLSDGFYRIKINNGIYAFKLNKDTIQKAKNFYLYSMNDGNTGYPLNVYNNIEHGKKIDSNIKLSDEEMLSIIYDNVYEEKYTKYHDEYYEEHKNDGLGSELENVSKEYADVRANEFAEAAKNSYLESKIAIKENSCYDIIPKDYIAFEDCINEDDTVNLTIDKLYAFLAYVFSPYNIDKGVVYKYNGAEWKELDNHHANVANGNLRISLINRVHCSNAYYATKGKYEEEAFTMKEIVDDYKLGYPNKEFDIRFDYIGSDELTISSVSEAELNRNVETKDFLQELFGYRRILKSYTTPEFEVEDIFSIDQLDGYSKFIISSPRTGQGSSLNLYGYGDLNSSIVSKVFDCPYVTVAKYTLDPPDYNEYSIWYTDKAYGIRKLEMFVNSNSTSYISRTSDLTTDIEINNGDFIFVDNDINLANTPEQILISYKLSVASTNGKLEINHRDNFYYTDGNDNRITYSEYCTRKGIDTMVAIEGASVYTDESNKKTIDTNLSRWSIKLTKNPYEDTNSYYSINEDPLETLNVTPCDNVSIVTTKLEPTDEEIGEVPLILGIDVYPDKSNEDRSASSELIYPETDIVVNMLADKLDAGGLLDSIQMAFESKMILLEEETSNIYSLRRSICRYEKDDSTRLVFTNINVNNGNIVFKYPSDKVWVSENKQEKICKLYKAIFGTNVTNKELYKLYPKECMDADTVFYVDESEEEYYYAPNYKYSEFHNLIFKYRTLEPRNALGEVESRYADYYIETEVNYADNGDINCNYWICKTGAAEFPDVGFYLHYVHDRTLVDEPNLEENILQRYLNKYMIAGTDYNILKPCFKTFDLEAKVYYNANYIEKNIREAVTQGLSEQYQLKNINNIVIDNKIYLSDIMKIMTSVEGVEHVDVTYFGLDAKQKYKYPTNTNYLKLDDKVSFYTMLVLADKSNGHGLNILYEKTE